MIQLYTIATPLSEVLSFRRGVCQDFAHLAIGSLRAYGIAARYISGYVETLPEPGKQRLTGQMPPMPGFQSTFPVLAG